MNDNPKICEECIGWTAMANWIHDNGQVGRCGVDPSHGSHRKVIPASEFAVEVDRWFRETYSQGEEEHYFDKDSDSSSYQQRGEPFREILGNELSCDEAVLLVIAEHLPDASHREIMQGGELFYDDSQNYEPFADIEKRENDDREEYWFENRFRYQWEDFCKAVQYGRRFFKLKEPLDDLFGTPDEYEKGNIRPLYMLPAGQKIYRARLLDDGFTEEKLRKKPAQELGAPPKERARAGRMNVEFIPAFYAAFSEEAAVAEIRPGIDEKVAIGEFVVQHELKVFDFTAFAKASGEQRKEIYGHTRYDFIDQMEGEISKPVLPYDKQREYIPTQIVAEYLGEYFGCDAVIFRSSMIKDYKIESRNIVLLNKSRPFEGAEDTPLKFAKFQIREIANVSYELADHIPF